MNRRRIASVVSETWGRGVVYSYDEPSIPAIATVKSSKAILPPPSKHVMEEETMSEGIPVQELLTPEAAEEEAVQGLTFLMACMYATVLEDVLGQMWCLDRCNTELQKIKTLHDIEHLKAIKYGVIHPVEDSDEISGVDTRNLDNIINKIKKLEKDRLCVNKVILSTFMALIKSHTYDPISAFIREHENLLKYRNELFEEEAKNRILRKELGRQVRQQRIHIKSVLYDMEVNIDALKTQVEDSALVCEVRSRYIDNWQNARTEQHNQAIFDIQNVPSTEINYYKRRYDHEQRVHTEVELLVNLAINETLATVEEWMEKYETDIENIDLRIQIQKNDYQNMRDKRMDLEDTLARHEVEMSAWIKFKEEREEARRYHELMTNSAIIVQAWWRGLIVRLQLGPFRPKKKRGHKKK